MIAARPTCPRPRFPPLEVFGRRPSVPAAPPSQGRIRNPSQEPPLALQDVGIQTGGVGEGSGEDGGILKAKFEALRGSRPREVNPQAHSGELAAASPPGARGESVSLRSAPTRSECETRRGPSGASFRAPSRAAPSAHRAPCAGRTAPAAVVGRPWRARRRYPSR